MYQFDRELEEPVLIILFPFICEAIFFFMHIDWLYENM